jgi:Lrp/AsnC family leucine-responsive transcriptional regulator
MIDTTDREILRIMQSDARISNAALARRLGLAPSGVLERVRKLEARGVIRGYGVRIAPAAVDKELLAFVFVKVEELPGETRTAEQLALIPEVLEVHHVAGEDCFLVKVRTAGTESLGRLLSERFGAIPTLRSTRSTIVLSTVKETMDLPIDETAVVEA